MIIERTTTVEAIVDVEFGMVVNIIGAKNRPLEFCIDHPGIRDAQGKRRRPFDGTVFVKSNDWDFYLGDTIWLPLEDKICLLYTSPSPRDQRGSRMPSSA